MSSNTPDIREAAEEENPSTGSVCDLPINTDEEAKVESQCQHKKHKECPGNEFHPFAKLPAQLRIKVWAHAASFPRIVPVKVTYVKLEKGEKYKSYNCKPKFISNISIPPVLHATYESREESLKKYKLSVFAPNTPATIYFNRLKDTAYYTADDGEQQEHTQLMDHFNLLPKEEIRYLALDDEIVNLTCSLGCPPTDYQDVCYDGLLELIFFDEHDFSVHKGRAVLGCSEVNKTTNIWSGEEYGDQLLEEYMDELQEEVLDACLQNKNLHPPEVKLMKVFKLGEEQ